jgi:hypothetical protein
MLVTHCNKNTAKRVLRHEQAPLAFYSYVRFRTAIRCRITPLLLISNVLFVLYRGIGVLGSFDTSWSLNPRGVATCPQCYNCVSKPVISSITSLHFHLHYPRNLRRCHSPPISPNPSNLPSHSRLLSIISSLSTPIVGLNPSRASKRARVMLRVDKWRLASVMEAVRRLRVVEGEVEDEGEGWGELMLSSEAELYSSAMSSREGDVRGDGETLCERAKRSSDVSCV